VIVIRDDQFAAIGAAAVRRRAERIYARLLEEHEDYPRHVFDAMFHAANELGYHEEQDAYRFCRLAPSLGEADPDNPMLWQVSPELVSPLMEASARLRFVEDEMMPRLLGDGWTAPSPEPTTPAKEAGARVRYDVYRSRLTMDFPDADET
jgi:hypothetical protein